ncbi:hypothetical protein EJ110_NYTH05236 [Nymphaea thermarum]|nr:hypothetical protein EJ110_NYTH05236 [Nymphaea thermarum]
MSSMVVKQVADAKFYEYGMRNNGNNGVCDRKQQLQSGKKVALRDLQNQTANLVPMPQGNSPLQKDGDSSRLSGGKRAKPTCSNPQCQQSICSCSKENLVYVRRKLETESFNLNVCDDGGFNSDAHTDENNLGGSFNELQGSNASQFLMFGSTPFPSLPSAQEPSFSHVIGKLSDYVASGEPDNTNAHPTTVDSQGNCIQHWKERFVRLQIFLKQCDEASRDDYVQMLRSLSAVGRSRHAVELEKRAIHLLLEEGKELHRMKALNVLGKSLPKNMTSLSEPHSVQAVSENIP